MPDASRPIARAEKAGARAKSVTERPRAFKKASFSAQIRQNRAAASSAFAAAST
jgi:hypothetical protein